MTYSDDNIPARNNIAQQMVGALNGVFSPYFPNHRWLVCYIPSRDAYDLVFAAKDYQTRNRIFKAMKDAGFTDINQRLGNDNFSMGVAHNGRGTLNPKNIVAICLNGNEDDFQQHLDWLNDNLPKIGNHVASKFNSVVVSSTQGPAQKGFADYADDLTGPTQRVLRWMASMVRRAALKFTPH